MLRGLSIIILNYNTKLITYKCVNSILKYQPQIPFEIIISDNGSKDGSQAMFKKKFGNDKKIKLINNKLNFGFAKGNNIAIKRRKFDTVLLLNSDTKVTDKAIDSLYNFSKSDKTIGVVAPQLLNKDNSIQPSCFNFPTINSAISEFILNKKNAFSKFYPLSKDKPVAVDSVVGAAFLITKTALKNVGLLDEKYFMYFEDIDYCKKVKASNLKVYYYPKAKVLHLHGASGQKKQVNSMLISSSKKYHGILKYYIITVIIKLSQFIKSK